MADVVAGPYLENLRQSRLLAPLSIGYGAAARARIWLYRSGTFKTHRLPVPVISVGNITTGGTGKTPVVYWLATKLSTGGLRVCILTRGYGRKDERRPVIVSDGRTILGSAEEAGDEARLLAEDLLSAGVAVISNKDRVAGGLHAFKAFASQVLILDDGFQHLRTFRNLDIVTVDATDPWGGGKLLPSGNLREPLDGLKRAHCIVLTRSDLVDDPAEMQAELSRLSRGRPLFTSRFQTRHIEPLHRPPAGGIGNELVKDFLAFCGIGNPAGFFAQLQHEGFSVVSKRSFRDHHRYLQADVDTLEVEARAQGAKSLITTAKDAVKLRSLRFSIPIFIFRIELELDNEAGLLNLIRKTVSTED